MKTKSLVSGMYMRFRAREAASTHTGLYIRFS